MKSQLIVKQLYLFVKLGHSVDERQTPQKVSIHLKLAFDRLLDACTNDNLIDTVCYARLAKAMQQFCDDRSFKLIEALTYQLYQFIKTKLPEHINNQVNIFLSVTKNPPLPTLEQTSFSISD